MRTHQLPVGTFVSALQLMRYEGIDLDEAECIIANLIYEVWIQYICLLYLLYYVLYYICYTISFILSLLCYKFTYRVE